MGHLKGFDLGMSSINLVPYYKKDRTRINSVISSNPVIRLKARADKNPIKKAQQCWASSTIRSD